ncbi:MAG: carboxypeptidase-like regulatory domain-containing protein [Fermentimonas sp.]|nr:carboxypeptidase-like regulatory domain-containing protein [Fermentimonas sp.]
MKQVLPFILFILLFPLAATSQTIITGSVTNKIGEPLPANITVQAKDGVSVAGFTTTDDKGHYTLNYKGSADSIIVTVSGMNVGKHGKIVLNKTQSVNFNIDEQPLEIKEVTVFAPKITLRGDTLNYLVSAYTDQNDRVIGDILKKMPGIEVASSGRIKYKGVDINKFYVENMDLLHGRYGIATNNIQAKDVATIQVYENHQPINALRNKVFSEQAALNLKLKESAKGTLALTGLAGVGYKPVLWNAELVSMYFGRTKQNMSTYKGNNSGDDVAGQFRTHYDYERVYMSSGSMLSVASPTSPPIPSNRYLYNQSNAVTTNQLFKMGNETELTVSALYYNDRIEKEGYSHYEQYLPGDSLFAIEERVNSVSKIHNAELALRLNKNATSFYLNNAFNLNGNWNDDVGSNITRSNTANYDETIVQRLSKPFFSVDNTLNLIKNIKDNSYGVYFSVGYGHKPHVLTVSPVEYFGNEQLESLSQHVLSNDFSSMLRVSYSVRIKKMNLKYDLWGRTDIRDMKTELLKKEIDGHSVAIDDSLKNDLLHNTYQTGFNQSYSFDNGIIKAKIELPLTYYNLVINDRIPGKQEKQSKLIVNPFLSVDYQIIPELNLSVGANVSKSYGGMDSRYTGYIMQNYRSLQRNSVDRLFETHSGGGRFSFSYRNVFQALFVNGGTNYSRSWRNMLYGYDYRGIMSVKTAIDQPTSSERFGVNINASKGLNFWSATVRASGEYHTGKSELLIQDSVFLIRSQGYNVNGSFNMVPLSFAGLTYSLSWYWNKSYKVDNPKSFSPIHAISQDVKINFFPTKTLTVNFGFEHQYNSAANPRFTYFSDGGVKYKYKQWDLELVMQNLFNAKQYVSASNSDVSTYFYSYNLRPASVLLKVRFKLK